MVKIANLFSSLPSTESLKSHLPTKVSALRAGLRVFTVWSFIVGISPSNSDLLQPLFYLTLSGLSSYYSGQTKDYANPKELRAMQAWAQHSVDQPKFSALAQEHGLEYLRKYNIAPLSQLQQSLINEVNAVGGIAKFIAINPKLTLAELEKHGFVKDFISLYKDYKNPVELRTMQARAQHPVDRPSFIALVQEHGLENLIQYKIAPIEQLQNGLIEGVKKAKGITQFLEQNPNLTLAALRNHGIITDQNWENISKIS